MTRITTDTMMLASGYRIVLGKTVAEVLKGAAALLTALLYFLAVWVGMNAFAKK